MPRRRANRCLFPPPRLALPAVATTSRAEPFAGRRISWRRFQATSTWPACSVTSESTPIRSGRRPRLPARHTRRRHPSVLRQWQPQRWDRYRRRHALPSVSLEGKARGMPRARAGPRARQGIFLGGVGRRWRRKPQNRGLRAADVLGRERSKNKKGGLSYLECTVFLLGMRGIIVWRCGWVSGRGCYVIVFTLYLGPCIFFCR